MYNIIYSHGKTSDFNITFYPRLSNPEQLTPFSNKHHIMSEDTNSQAETSRNVFKEQFTAQFVLFKKGRYSFYDFGKDRKNLRKFNYNSL